MNQKERSGFLYIATGKHFLEEAIVSAKSLKESCPNSPIAVCTDQHNVEKAKGFFEHVLIIEDPQYNFIDKIGPLVKTPFERTIFLDTDTYIVEDITQLFDLLDKYDFIAALAPGREQFRLQEIPPYFPELNTGVIGYKSSKVTNRALQNWLSIYTQQLQSDLIPPHDQPAFRMALFKSEARIFVLPGEYNFRITNQNIVWGNSKVKLIHGRHNNFKKLSTLLNKNEKLVRFYYLDLRYLTDNWLSFIELSQNKYLSVRIVRFFLKTFGRIEEKLRRKKMITKKKGNE